MLGFLDKLDYTRSADERLGFEKRLDLRLAMLREKGKSARPEDKTFETIDEIARILQSNGINWRSGTKIFKVNINPFTAERPSRNNLRLKELDDLLTAFKKDPQLDGGLQEAYSDLERTVQIAQAALVIQAVSLNETPETPFEKALEVLESILKVDFVFKSQRPQFAAARQLLFATVGVQEALKRCLGVIKPLNLELKARLNKIIDLIWVIHAPPELYQRGEYAPLPYLFHIIKCRPRVFELDAKQNRIGVLINFFIELAESDVRDNRGDLVLLPSNKHDPDEWAYSVFFSNGTELKQKGHLEWNLSGWFWKKGDHSDNYSTLQEFLDANSSRQPVIPSYPFEDRVYYLRFQPEFIASDVEKLVVCDKQKPWAIVFHPPGNTPQIYTAWVYFDKHIDEFSFRHDSETGLCTLLEEGKVTRWPECLRIRYPGVEVGLYELQMGGKP